MTTLSCPTSASRTRRQTAAWRDRDVELVTEHYSRGQLAGKSPKRDLYRCIGPAGSRTGGTPLDPHGIWSGSDDVRRSRRARLRYLGFTPRQTRFLATVALHSGFCVRRQFSAFAGVEYGKNVRNFLDQPWSIVDLARRLPVRNQFGARLPPAAPVRCIAAIGQDDNRNRRAACAALIARKLMLLDFVLAQRRGSSGVPPSQTRWRCSGTASRRSRSPTCLAGCTSRATPSDTSSPCPLLSSQGAHLPSAGDPPTVHFVFLATEPTTEALRCGSSGTTAALFRRLPQWAVALVCPSHLWMCRAFRMASDTLPDRFDR